MSQTKKILLSFLIPLILAIVLEFLGSYFFPTCHSSYTKIDGIVFCLEYHSVPLPVDVSFAEKGYALLILSLFICSLILPSFITLRVYQNKESQLIKPSSIIE